jgi:hypothetical protein
MFGCQLQAPEHHLKNQSRHCWIFKLLILHRLPGILGIMSKDTRAVLVTQSRVHLKPAFGSLSLIITGVSRTITGGLAAQIWFYMSYTFPMHVKKVEIYHTPV